MTTRKRTRNSQPEVGTEEVTLVSEEQTSPVEAEMKTAEEPPAPAPSPDPEKVQTDVRAKLAKRSDREDVFVPSTPPQLESDARALAEMRGFDFNRGTSVGARLMARAQQQNPR